MTTILYVEDNPANLALIHNLIDLMNGYTLLTTLNAEDGIEIAIAKQPDIILMDINLPGMNGYEALEILTANEATKHIPVVAVTANAMKEHVKKGKESGFKSYITKPIDIKGLVEVLNTYSVDK